MSTPAVILLYDGSGKLAARYFHHWDGYPENLGNILLSLASLARDTAATRVSGVPAARTTPIRELMRLLKLCPDFVKSGPCDFEYLYRIRFTQGVSTYSDYSLEYAGCSDAIVDNHFSGNWDGSRVKWKSIVSYIA